MHALQNILCLAVSTVLGAENKGNTGAIRATNSKTEVMKGPNISSPLPSVKDRAVLSERHARMREIAFDRHFKKRDETRVGEIVSKRGSKEEENLSSEETTENTKDNRKLYKSKTGLSKLMMNDDGYSHFQNNDYIHPESGYDTGRLNQNDNPYWDGEESWHATMNEVTDANNQYTSYSKSSKSSVSSSSKSGKSGGGNGGNGLCEVTVTNLSYEQAFSKLFMMLHDKAVTDLFPIYEFGKNPTKALCDLTQNLNANEMLTYYSGRPGVYRTWISSYNFTSDSGDVNSQYLRGGGRFTTMIRQESNYISLAAGFPFANDGGIVLQAAPIYDGAEYYLPAIDSGCEANLQTCWSVPAKQKDFPPRAACYDETFSDENSNEIAGENFVSIHRGMQDLDSKEDALELTLLECSDADLDNTNDDIRFARYFYQEGYDDDMLLCASIGPGGFCRFRSDDNFLSFVKSNNDIVGDDDVLIRIAKNSDDFNEFCDSISEINKGLESAFTTLESIIFDWRNPIAHVMIHC